MTRPTRTPAGAVVTITLIGLFTAGVTGSLSALGWAGEQLLLVFGLARPWWWWPAVSVVNGLLVAAPAAIAALLSRSVRPVGLAWLAGAGAAGLLGALRAVPPDAAEAYLALLAAGALILGYAWRRSPAHPAAGDPGAGGGLAAGAAAVVAGLVVLLPWLAFGALGGWLETLLAAAAAAALGWLAGGLLPRERPSRPRDILRHGAVGAVTLLLVAAGAGASGAQLPMLLVLPPLGLVAAALPDPVPRWAVPALIGAASFGPLGFVDPQEVTLLLTGRDVPVWTALAAAGSLLLGLLIGAALTGWAAAARRRATRAERGRVREGRATRRRALERLVAITAVAAALLAAGGVHLTAGQPGLHGDRLFVVLAAQADLSRLDPELLAGTGQAGRDARATAVYQLLVDHARTTQADLRAELDRLGLAYTPYYLVNAVEVTGGPAVRAWLSRRDDVDRVLPSQRLRPLPLPPPATGGRAGLPADPEWNIALIGADRVWREWGVTGAGIVVGSADSGVDGAHPALAAGFRGGDDSWLDPWNGTTTPTDRIGHGTHTLGSAVGAEGIGVAPGAEWTACVNLDRNLGNPAYYLDCLQFMLAPYPPGGDPFRDGRPVRAPHILTNSWSCPPIEGCDRGVLRPAAEALRAAGIYLVVAAGNTGPRCGSITDPPAPYPDVLTVGAIDREQRVATFSSRGEGTNPDKPDLVAPGVGVVSAMPGGGYAAQSGTSMATPHLAGVVALMWSAQPALIGDVDTTTRLLHQTARPLPGGTEVSCGGIRALAGSGVVDAYAAVQAALTVD